MQTRSWQVGVGPENLHSPGDIDAAGLGPTWRTPGLVGKSVSLVPDGLALPCGSATDLVHDGNTLLGHSLPQFPQP